MDMLKQKAYEIWALENSRNSIPINSAISQGENLKNLVLVVGNEVTGVDTGILESADRLVYLPMRGQKRSFNVAVSFALAAQTLTALLIKTRG
jgi:tRNA G18 (ribose-2'-O)-methylase SpoU